MGPHHKGFARPGPQMDGKRIVLARNLIVPPYVSKILRDESAQLFNVFGTHAYREAVVMSVMLTGAGQPTAVQEDVHYFIGENLGRVLATSGLTAAYYLDQFPRLQAQYALGLITAVEDATANLLRVRIDFRDPMLSGYQASF